MVRLRSACPLDCPDGCSLSVEVAGGEITWVGAAPPEAEDANPFTAGFICAKVKRYHERVHGPRRLRTPLIRTGPKGSGEFRPASWEEALDLVADRIAGAAADGGPATVAPYLYNSSAGYLGANGLTPLLFRAFESPSPRPSLGEPSQIATFSPRSRGRTRGSRTNGSC